LLLWAFDLHEVSLATFENLEEFVLTKLRTIEGIKETMTLINFKRGDECPK